MSKNSNTNRKCLDTHTQHSRAHIGLNEDFRLKCSSFIYHHIAFHSSSYCFSFIDMIDSKRSCKFSVIVL
uniref:Uncharacterized protein n=1 Tax=Anguilla anguilla TaxID=7936 RepID=A0A0E9WFG7_ANGAN